MLRTVGLVIAFTVATIASVDAADADVEVFGGLAFWLPRVDTQYDASYTPSRVVSINQLFTDPDPRSHARQLLTLKGATSLGLGLGVNVFPHRVVGFQFLLDRGSIDVTGENPPHEVELTYDTIAFPNPDPIVATTDFSFPQPDTEGTLEQTTLSFNLVARLGAGRAVSGSLSGGLSYFRYDVAAQRLGAHTAWLGGHAVLFSELYETSYASGPAKAFGFNLGGELDVALGPHAALFVDGRFLLAPKTESTLGLDAILSTNVITVPLQQIEDFLALPPLEVDPGYFRVLVGLKWKL